MQELTARIPFDDRSNRQASIQDFDLSLIQAFLHEVKSDLFEESKSMSLADLSRNMLIAKGPDEELRPINVGLLFFTQKPELYFSRCWIEVVVHKDFSGKGFTETYFKGPIHQQLRDVLRFIQTTVIHEVIEKLPDRAEANRYFNFPFIAVEEALSNAVYHKSYEIGNPIEVQIWPDKIEILRFPGPIPPVDAKILQEQKRIVSRDNRNRRIGDFLKELDLTEGRGTGFPTIYREMEKNGSPKPIFETDESSTYFLCVLPVNTNFVEQASKCHKTTRILPSISTLSDLITFINQSSVGASVGVGDQVEQIENILNSQIHDKIETILDFLKVPKARTDIFIHLSLTNHSKNRARYLDPLVKYQWIELTHPSNLTHPKQQYRITESGRKLLEILKINA